jgi:hypothetical protein
MRTYSSRLLGGALSVAVFGAPFRSPGNFDLSAKKRVKRRQETLCMLTPFDKTRLPLTTDRLERLSNSASSFVLIAAIHLRRFAVVFCQSRIPRRPVSVSSDVCPFKDKTVMLITLMGP